MDAMNKSDKYYLSERRIKSQDDSMKFTVIGWIGIILIIIILALTSCSDRVTCHTYTKTKYKRENVKYKPAIYTIKVKK